MTYYRKQLNVLAAESEDVTNETEFYDVKEVDGIINDIEQRVNEALRGIDEFEKWPLKDVETKLDEIRDILKGLSKDLY